MNNTEKLVSAMATLKAVYGELNESPDNWPHLYEKMSEAIVLLEEIYDADEPKAVITSDVVTAALDVLQAGATTSEAADCGSFVETAQMARVLADRLEDLGQRIASDALRKAGSC